MVKPFFEVLIRLSPVDSEKFTSSCMTTELLMIFAFQSLDIVIKQETEEQQFAIRKIISCIFKFILTSGDK